VTQIASTLREDVLDCVIISRLILLRVTNVSGKVVEEVKIDFFYFQKHFLNENRALVR